MTQTPGVFVLGGICFLVAPKTGAAWFLSGPNWVEQVWSAMVRGTSCIKTVFLPHSRAAWARVAGRTNAITMTWDPPNRSKHNLGFTGGPVLSSMGLAPSHW